MKLYVRIRAEHEMNQAATWYEQQSAGLGREFLNSIAKLFEIIRGQPLSFARIGGEVRPVPMRAFPYALFYLVDRRGIQVLRCLHQHRNPSSWPSTQH